MSVNSSSPSNFLHSVVLICYDSSLSTAVSVAFTATRAFLLLPLSILVLYLGHRRWRQQRSFTTTSHSDIFAYHMAALELIWGLGSACFYIDLREMKIMGYWLKAMAFSGESLFHILTCVERYLAVVHPIPYMGLRRGQGVRIRNISIGCVWLLGFGVGGVMALLSSTLSVSILFFVVSFSLVVVSFCCFSVLHVLIRPGPGEVGGTRQQVDQSKQRAFHTVMAIMGVLWLWFIGVLATVAVRVSPLLSTEVGCVVKSGVIWSNLPSSVVVPLLYLHRAGKLARCC